MNKELEEKIDGANSIEELEKIEEELKQEPQVEEVVEEVLEEIQEQEEPTEVEITPEEERKLVKETEQVEERKLTNLSVVERKGEQKMETEVRNSKEYIDAFAEYCKGNKDAKELTRLNQRLLTP